MRSKLTPTALLFVFAAGTAIAFAPYESHILTASVKRAALIASVKPGSEAPLDAALGKLAGKRAVKALEKADITNLSCYKKELGGKTWVMLYFDYEGRDYLKAAADFESAGDAVLALNAHIDSHPHAKRYGTTWLQMEWITYIRGSRSEADIENACSMVTTLEPEKEAEYRLLHQTVWPGVCDQMARGNHRNFSIFLTEIDDTLYEFFYVEYVGSDAEKDGEMDRTDPINIRWWKQTDPCQTPLPGTDGIWTMMDKITPCED